MAVDTPAGHVYIGNGNTRVFPIPTRIIGDDYVRIELDGVYLSDRTQWDIVNNSIIFITAPANGVVVNIKVATSEEALAVLGSSTNVDIVATNMTDVNTVANNIEEVQSAYANAVIATTKADEASISASASDTSATTASIKASEASASATSASTSASTAVTKAAEAVVSASNASESASNASESASNASESASNALASENKANKWADNNYNVEVETGKYSAKHWATVSQNSVGVKVVENISSLKTFNASDSNQVEVLGYYSKGDGGGGLFYWDNTSTETDNGGTIIQATGVVTGRWKRLFNGAINVKWFGAKGDGITDDTVAIQAAVDLEVPLFIPIGTFLISSIIVTGSLEMFASSQYAIIKHSIVASATDMFSMDSATGPIVIKGLTFDGQQQNQPQTPISIRLFGASINPNPIEYKFENCRFLNVHTGAIFVQTDNIVRGKLDVINCHFENILELSDSDWNPSFCTFSEAFDAYFAGNTFKAGYVFTLDGAMAINHSSRSAGNPVNEYARIRIVGNYIEGMGRAALVSGNGLGAIELRLWTEATTISNNNFKNCFYVPIRWKSDSKDTVVTGNSIDTVLNGEGIAALRGVSTGPIVGRNLIANNSITNASDGIISFGGTGQYTDVFECTGNVITNVLGNGIHGDSNTQVVVAENTIKGCGLVGIRLSECTVANVTSNSIYNCEKQGIYTSNGSSVVITGNNVRMPSDIGISVNNYTYVNVSNNIVLERANVASGRNVDYRITNGTTGVIIANLGNSSGIGTISTFGFTKIINTNNSWS